MNSTERLLNPADSKGSMLYKVLCRFGLFAIFNFFQHHISYALHNKRPSVSRIKPTKVKLI